MNRGLIFQCIAIVALLYALGWPPATAASATSKPTVAEAQKFVAGAEAALSDLTIKFNRASWVQSNFITDDTEAIAAEAQKQLTAAATKFAEKTRRYAGLRLPSATARKMQLLKRGLTTPAPRDPAERDELTKIAVSLESDYGKGKYCPGGTNKTGASGQLAPGKPCLTLNDMEKIMAESRDPEELKKIWLAWHRIAPPLKPRYTRFVALADKGARELGYADMGALWRSKYDMPPDQFADEMERLWQQVKPLYDALYVYTRKQLIKQYGADVVPANGPIPAHLLGNMWSQSWENIYPLLKPAASDPGYDLTKILRLRNTDARQMVKYGEAFFVSLGFDPLPATFWERSLFEKPRDREVVCHASAWDIDNQNDLRVKMCIKIDEEDFATVHHELGHNFYQRAYASRTPLYQDSANDGFHEAIGDTIALSLTPEYYKKIGLIDTVPDSQADIGLLMARALEKVAFLPFGYLVDQWRWKVFAGAIAPADYNKSWWRLREKYQGIGPPAQRSEADFDPGAKYHVAGNVPYTRYFIAHILQFQFHRALCKEAGYTGPLHRCSIYGNKAAGAKLKQMLEMGASRPWPEALKAMTGEDKMDATAILDYFAPLKAWLDQRNAQ